MFADMAQLSDSERRRIVQRLACYETPSEVAEWATNKFGKNVGRQQVEHYDPTRSDRTGQQWEELFWKTRERFNNDARRVAIAQKLWRLRQLQEIATDEDTSEKDSLQALEQAARERGGDFTNRMEHSGPGGAPIAHSHDIDLSELTDQQIERLAAGEPPEDVL